MINRFIFPTFYLIYVCVAVLFGGEEDSDEFFQTVIAIYDHINYAAPILIIGALFKGEVFCISDSFIESMMNSSPFCTISGMLSCYIIIIIPVI